MSGLAFEMSDAAVAAVFGGGGFLVAMVPKWIAGKGKKMITQEECIRAHDKNDLQHKEFYDRLETLEKSDARSTVVLEHINKHLESIDQKLDKL